jgi:signal transduction histidine kinase
MTSEKIQRIFISVNEKVQSLLKPGRFYITLYDPRRARVEFPWVVENETNKLEWGVRELDNNLLPDHVLVNGSALHYERDVATHIKESELTYWPGDEIPASWLGVPIVFEGKTLGVMIVESNIPGAFDQRAATLLSAIAGQTATALERVRLDEDLARRIRDLDAVNTFGQKLSSEIQLSESEILNLIHEQASELMDTENMYIALYDRETDTVRFGLMYVDGKPTYVESRRGGKGRTEWIIRNREPILDLTKEQSQAWYKMDGRQEYIGEPFASWIGVPMIVRDQVIGVIATYNKDKDFVYDEDDLIILSSMANQAAIALDNARLLNHINQSVTELKERNNELQRLQGEIADKEQELVTTSIAMDFIHKINNLAGPIAPWITLLKRELSAISVENPLVNDYLENIKKDAGLILLEAHELRKPTLDVEEIDVETMVGSIVGQLQMMTTSEIQFECAPEIPHLFAIQRQLSNAIFSIVENATKAVSQGGEVSITVSLDKSYVLIEVSDTGIGIPEDKLKTIFEYGKSYWPDGSGTGYGLWRAKRVIENTHGQISVKSEVGRGSTFLIRLPPNTRI